MKYYCLGIKGTGMSTLAQILYDLGNEVSGYDDAKGYKFTQKGLEERNIPIYYDHDHQFPKDTIVTYSVALGVNHPELVRVRNMGLTIKKYNEIMGDVISEFKSIGVSGTHGKTTTSSLIKHILEENGGCNYFIGAGDGYASRDNDYFVVESDEFNRHFTAYHPTYAIITNIEREHMECYVRKINYKTKVLFYGFGFNNDAVIKNMKLDEDASRFDLYINEELYGSFEVPLFGKHMVSDTVAAILMCRELGISKEAIYDALKTFKNAKRRFAISRIDETIIVDDYAHHPTEIKDTLEAVRQKFPDKRVVVVFKPNTYSRTIDFKNEFIDALNVADKAFLTEIDCNREKPEDYPGVTSQIIVDGLRNGDMISEETIDKLIPEFNSVIVFMSCAYVDGLINALAKLKENIKKEED